MRLVAEGHLSPRDEGQHGRFLGDKAVGTMRKGRSLEGLRAASIIGASGHGPTCPQLSRFLNPH
jgi:hypothetical protein